MPYTVASPRPVLPAADSRVVLVVDLVHIYPGDRDGELAALDVASRAFTARFPNTCSVVGPVGLDHPRVVDGAMASSTFSPSSQLRIFPESYTR